MYWLIIKQNHVRDPHDFVGKDMPVLNTTIIETKGEHQRNTNIGKHVSKMQKKVILKKKEIHKMTLKGY